MAFKSQPEMHQMVWWSKTKKVHGNKEIKKVPKSYRGCKQNIKHDKWKVGHAIIKDTLVERKYNNKIMKAAF